MTTTTTDSAAAVATPTDAVAFLSATRTDREAIRAAASAAALSAMTTGEMDVATGHMQCVVWYDAHMKDARVTTPTATPAEQVARRIATLRMAADLLEADAFRPDGIGDYTTDDVLNHLSTDAHPDPDRAIVIASAKVGRSARSATRNELTDAIRSAWVGQPVGTVLTVPEVMDAIGCPRDWNGRISARLAAPAGCTVPGIVGTTTDGGKVAGRNEEVVD
jgi:uncharacterized protein (DUF4415 family)